MPQTTAAPKETRKPIEINVRNEGHEFYTDNDVKAKTLRGAINQAAEAVRELKRVLPAGTWTADVWQSGKMQAELHSDGTMTDYRQMAEATITR